MLFGIVIAVSIYWYEVLPTRTLYAAVVQVSTIAADILQYFLYPAISSISILTMSEQTGPKYVLDLPFGGTASYDAVVGDGAPESSTPHDRVWPQIPLEFRPAAPEIENAVKEGMRWNKYHLL